MTPTLRSDTARLFALLALFPAATLAARTVLSRPFQDGSLNLRYPTPRGSLTDAAAILLENTRVAALIVGATILVATVPAARLPLTLILAGVAGLNVAMISIALADEGTRAALALLPHGPVELLAF